MKRTVLLVLIAGLASTSQAQSAPVTVRGLAYDSLHGKALAGAFIIIDGTKRSAMSDASGRFRFDSVAPGTYRILMQHDVIDAIGMSAAGTRAVVTDGRTIVTVSVPSFATLWRAACAAPPPPADTGLLFGTVRPGKDAPKTANAVVVASWIDITKDSNSVIRQKRVALETNADSTGNFAVCGVPTSTGVSVRASLDSTESGLVDVAPLDKERIARRDLTLGPSLASIVAAQRGATLTGHVVDSTRRPIPNVEVSLPELGLQTMTNDSGAFTLTNIVPGSHAVGARHVGYGAKADGVEFNEGTTVDHTFVLQHVTVLDSVNVNAAKSYHHDPEMDQFEENRKMGLGHFLTRADLAKQDGRMMSEVLAQFPGVRLVRGPTGQAYLSSSHGDKSITPGCEPVKEDMPTPLPPGRRPPPPPPPCTTACYAQVYMDNQLISINVLPNLNRILVGTVEAIEYYSGGAETPPQYQRLNSQCGVIVFHTIRPPEGASPPG